MPGSEFTFELASKIDKEKETRKQVMEIFVKAFLALPIYKRDGDILKKAISERIDLLNKSTGSHQAILARENGIVVGIIFSEKEGHNLYLATGTVLPQHQKKGLAKKMLGSLLAHNKDIKEIFLVTREDNIDAVKLYEYIFTKDFTIYQKYPFLSKRGYKYPPYIPFKIDINKIQEHYPGLSFFNTKSSLKQTTQKKENSIDKTINEVRPLTAKL